MDIDDFLILRSGEAVGLVTPEEALAALEAAWREETTLSAPTAMALDTPAAALRVKGGALPQAGVAGFRLMAGPAREWVLLADLAGQPLALVEAAWLRALRTAASAALAARLLAPGARSAALIGAGRIAAHLPAVLAAALPALATLHVAARRAEAVAAFCETQPEGTLRLQPAASPAAAAAEADLVITLTSATTPVLAAADLRPGQTVIGLGAADLAADVLTGWATAFYSDATDLSAAGGSPGAWTAAGAVTQAALAARLTAGLGALAAGAAPAQGNILAVLQGLATGDVALADWARRKARLRRMGLRFPIVEPAGPTRPRGPAPRRVRSFR